MHAHVSRFSTQDVTRPDARECTGARITRRAARSRQAGRQHRGVEGGVGGRHEPASVSQQGGRTNAPPACRLTAPADSSMPPGLRTPQRAAGRERAGAAKRAATCPRHPGLRWRAIFRDRRGDRGTLPQSTRPDQMTHAVPRGRMSPHPHQFADAVSISASRRRQFNPSVSTTTGPRPRATEPRRSCWNVGRTSPPAQITHLKRARAAAPQFVQPAEARDRAPKPEVPNQPPRLSVLDTSERAAICFRSLSG